MAWVQSLPEPAGKDRNEITIVDEHNKLVAVLPCSPINPPSAWKKTAGLLTMDEQMRNARRIKAAPLMEAALRDALHYFEDAPCGHPALVNVLRFAYQQSTGRNPEEG